MSVIAFFIVALNTIIYRNNLSQSTDSKFLLHEIEFRKLTSGPCILPTLKIQLFLYIKPRPPHTHFLDGAMVFVSTKKYNLRN